MAQAGPGTLNLTFPTNSCRSVSGKSSLLTASEWIKSPAGDEQAVTRRVSLLKPFRRSPGHKKVENLE
jgi:hypothetical protein